MKSEQPTEGRKTQVDKEVEDRIGQDVDWDFSSGRKKLFRDVLNFWPSGGDYLKKVSPEELREYFDRLKPMLHYQEGYIEKGERDVNNMREDSGEEADEFHKLYYPKALERIMELSDPGQIVKYNKLADEFNEDFERIKRECDIDGLQKYFNKARMIVDGKK